MLAKVMNSKKQNKTKINQYLVPFMRVLIINFKVLKLSKTVLSCTFANG